MSQKTILIVEDDIDIQSSLKSLLEIEGYTVLTANNGKDGLILLGEGASPCLILLDFMMPVMNGHEFALELKKDKTKSGIPIVVVSAYDERAKAIPSSAFVRKPIDINGLLKHVEEYCAAA